MFIFGIYEERKMELKQNALDIEELSNRFYYDETSPTCLRYKEDVYIGIKNSQLRFRIGDVAGCFHKSTGYYIVGINGKKSIRVHRVILCILNYDINNFFVDHLDGDKTNNKVANLRLTERKENNRNSKIRHDNKTGVCGVFRSKIDRYGRERFVAVWKEGGKSNSKSFSIRKYGESEAFRLACEYRKQKITELNDQGAGYTERHGT